MLRLNKMTDYAIRVVRAIYLSPDQVVTSVNISEQENIPLPILFKVLRILNTAGVVASRRGRGDKVGGYELLKDPSDLTLLDIVQVVQGDIFLSDCLQDPTICCHQNGCGVHMEMQRINDVLRRECASKSILEMISGPAKMDKKAIAK